jgi:hypothetical protein
MIGVEVKDGWYIITLPKLVLVLDQPSFVNALRQGKQLRRHQALADRLAAAAVQRQPT